MVSVMSDLFIYMNSYINNMEGQTSTTVHYDKVVIMNSCGNSKLYTPRHKYIELRRRNGTTLYEFLQASEPILWRSFDKLVFVYIYSNGLYACSKKDYRSDGLLIYSGTTQKINLLKSFMVNIVPISKLVREKKVVWITQKDLVEFYLDYLTKRCGLREFNVSDVVHAFAPLKVKPDYVRSISYEWARKNGFEVTSGRAYKRVTKED